MQDADTKDGANVMSYACGTRPGGNQRWSVLKGGGGGGATVVTKLDGKCLGAMAGNHSATQITGALHESTLGSVFINRTFLGLLDNQGHNGHDTNAAVTVAPEALPQPGSGAATRSADAVPPPPPPLPSPVCGCQQTDDIGWHSPGVVCVELFSSTVGISADLASMMVSLAKSVEYLGLKSLSIAGQDVAGPWAMQVGLPLSFVDLSLHYFAALY